MDIQGTKAIQSGELRDRRKSKIAGLVGGLIGWYVKEEQEQQEDGM